MLFSAAASCRLRRAWYSYLDLRVLPAAAVADRCGLRWMKTAPPAQRDAPRPSAFFTLPMPGMKIHYFSVPACFNFYYYSSLLPFCLSCVPVSVQRATMYASTRFWALLGMQYHLSFAWWAVVGNMVKLSGGVDFSAVPPPFRWR